MQNMEEKWLYVTESLRNFKVIMMIFELYTKRIEMIKGKNEIFTKNADIFLV